MELVKCAGKKYDQNINVPKNYSRTVKMCSLYRVAWSRKWKWTASAHSNVISIPHLLIAQKWYTILECLRERDTRCGSGRNGQKLSGSGLKGIVHPKMKILSSFTHPQVVPNLYEFLCSAEHKGRYFEESL